MNVYRPDPPKNSALLTDEELRQVAARAMSLYERVEGPPQRIQLSEEAFRPQLDFWREQVAEGDSELFGRRLRAEGLDPPDLPGILRGPVFTASELPAWCLFFNEAFQ